jgi:hypothetical protein
VLQAARLKTMRAALDPGRPLFRHSTQAPVPLDHRQYAVGENSTLSGFGTDALLQIALAHGTRAAHGLALERRAKAAES